MPKELPTVFLENGQEVVLQVNPGQKIVNTTVNAAKTRRRYQSQPGPYVEPVPDLVYTSSISTGSTLSGTVHWTASITAGAPTKMEFYVDGVLRYLDETPEYGFDLDTKALTNGVHTLTVEGFDAKGQHPPVGGQVTIDNPIIPIPPTTPFPGFAKADAAVSAGGFVDVPAGVYKERFTLSKPGVTWRLAKGAIIDLAGFNIPVQQSGVYLKGNDIKFIGEGEIKNSSAAGYTVDGDRVTVTINVHHCVEEGYVWHGADGLMLGGENHHNNETGQMWDSSEQGAGKANCQRLTVDGVYVHHIGMGGASSDAGQGIWYDSIGQFSNGEVKNCVIHDVFYAGIFWEISQDGKLHDNVIHHSGNTPSGNGWWGSGLLSSSSRRTDIYNNIIAFNKYNGIRVLCQNRGDRPGDTTGVTVHHNTIIGNGTGISFGTDNAAIKSVMFGPNAGNTVFANKFDVPKVYWETRGTLTNINDINTLPGGGGNTVMTPAEVAAVLAQYNITK